MGYKICTSGIQNFLGYELTKWGIVPQNRVQLAVLVPPVSIEKYLISQVFLRIPIEETILHPMSLIWCYINTILMNF
jgi:hypothetical protein